ncbi:hypothetical protein NQ314_004069, partial [Rhamnusium bicolor]
VKDARLITFCYGIARASSWNDDPDRLEDRLDRISCIADVSARQGQMELFFLRVLLRHVAGSTSFEELRTVDGRIYSTFREACEARHLLRALDEYDRCMRESVGFRFPGQLRRLFVTIIDILDDDRLAEVVHLWHTYKNFLIEDFVDIQGMTRQQAIVRCLELMRAMLARVRPEITLEMLGIVLTDDDRDDVPTFIVDDVDDGDIGTVVRQRNVYDPASLNVDQKRIFIRILRCIARDRNIDFPLDLYDMMGDDLTVKELLGAGGERGVRRLLENHLLDFVYGGVFYGNEVGDRAILCPTNVTVDEVNSLILNKLGGEVTSYFSVDSVKEDPGDRLRIPTDLLNSVNVSGLPPHELKLKSASDSNIHIRSTEKQEKCTSDIDTKRVKQRQTIDVKSVKIKKRHQEKWVNIKPRVYDKTIKTGGKKPITTSEEFQTRQESGQKIVLKSTLTKEQALQAPYCSDYEREMAAPSGGDDAAAAIRRAAPPPRVIIARGDIADVADTMEAFGVQGEGDELLEQIDVSQVVRYRQRDIPLDDEQRVDVLSYQESDGLLIPDRSEAELRARVSTVDRPGTSGLRVPSIPLRTWYQVLRDDEDSDSSD